MIFGYIVWCPTIHSKFDHQGLNDLNWMQLGGSWDSFQTVQLDSRSTLFEQDTPHHRKGAGFRCEREQLHQVERLSERAVECSTMIGTPKIYVYRKMKWRKMF